MVIVGLREVHGSTVEQLFWIVQRRTVPWKTVDIANILNIYTEKLDTIHGP